MSGLLGLLCSPIFRMDGILVTGASAESLNMLLWNFVGAVCILCYYIVMSSILFLGLDRMGLFRVDPQAETQGLDIIKHNEKAYDFSKLISYAIPTAQAFAALG